MTERARNIVIAVALAGIAALLTGLYVTSYQRQVQQGEEHVTVFVAARDIPAGTSGADAVARGLVSHKSITRTGVVPGAVSNTNQITGLVATQQIFAGEQITKLRFSQSAVQGIQGQLTGTQRGYQVHGDPNQLLAGTLRAGDHVDLVATFTEAPITRTILRNIYVLRASTSTEDGATKVTSGLTGSGNVILRLTDAQAQKLDFTINVASRVSDDQPKWHLTLRSPLKSDDTPDSITTFESIVLDGLNSQQRARIEANMRGQG
jgi:Flp pilus assembly protein CpaB